VYAIAYLFIILYLLGMVAAWIKSGQDMENENKEER
jgi:hypothetical protein